ncbi:hypothetical protein KBI23_13805 [bacterium]|nr:hypothetical protein [bacterium]MBP9811211.1 hypothetical protein [bacterium]
MVLQRTIQHQIPLAPTQRRRHPGDRRNEIRISRTEQRKTTTSRALPQRWQGKCFRRPAQQPQSPFVATGAGDASAALVATKKIITCVGSKNERRNTTLVLAYPLTHSAAAAQRCD